MRIFLTTELNYTVPIFYQVKKWQTQSSWIPQAADCGAKYFYQFTQFYCSILTIIPFAETSIQKNAEG